MNLEFVSIYPSLEDTHLELLLLDHCDLAIEGFHSERLPLVKHAVVMHFP
jgi:hypothetical protein